METSQNPYVFKKYNKYTNLYEKDNPVNLDFNLGSHIDNYYPHHAGANQQIEIKGSVSAARINYKYGFIDKIEDDISLNKAPGADVYYNWTNTYNSYRILDPLETNSVTIKPIFNSGEGTSFIPQLVLSSNDKTYNKNTFLNFKIKAEKTNFNESYVIDQGEGTSIITILPFYFIYFAFRFVDINNKIYWLERNSQNEIFWTEKPNSLDEYAQNTIRYVTDTSVSVELNLPLLPENGAFKVFILTPIAEYNDAFTSTGPTTPVRYFDAKLSSSNPSETTGTNVVGEFHTVQRQNRPSSIALQTSTVFNGDTVSSYYYGTIFKSDQLTPTVKWFRKGIQESKPILRIAAEDLLRIQQKPAKIFSGDIYGYLPYLSVISINNVLGKFMPIEYSFNTLTNMINIKLLEGFTDELNDIEYKYTLDYGNTVKPTITS
jgi:hypothetical protein